jgi:putative ABC transport system ATP-binding protein
LDLKNVSSISDVELATPMLMHQFLKKDEKTGKIAPHIIYGINIEEMKKLKPWWTVRGRFFQDNETNVMLVGRDLADKENLSVGQVLPVGPKKEDFSVEAGEFVSIIGPSGSGKTALLNVLGCLDMPSDGSLKLNGIETAGQKERDLVKLRRANIGFVFQQFYLMPTLTARENIELPLLFSRKDRNKKRIDEVLQMVGLADRSDHLPSQLSGGEMQRVAIGRALINDPRIILADEPTGNLDSATSEMIFELFRELNRQGMTLVVVTHNLDLARQAEKMYTLRDGRIVGCEEMRCLQGIEVRLVVD